MPRNEAPAPAAFRGSDAAASLKRDSLDLTLPAYGRLPRQRCRGLIEAAKLSSLATEGVPVFRGSDAAASLKPRMVGRRQPSVARLPRQRCRGLIEAP